MVGVSFYGMDTAAVEDFAALLETRQGTLAEKADSLSSVVGGIDAFWIGSDAEGFRNEFTGVRTGQIDPLLERLAELARELERHVDQQNTASDADGAGGGDDGFDWGDVFQVGDFPGWGSLIPNTWQQITGLGLSTIQNSAQPLSNLMRNNAWRAFARGGEEAVVPVLRNADYLSRAGKALGPVGTAFTAVTAGWDRWQEDADDPSLSTTERTVRTGADAGANVAGAAAGAWGGAKLGAMGGAAIGSVIPGVGTAIGGVVGGVAGAVVGGFVGGGLADTAVDWLLG